MSETPEAKKTDFRNGFSIRGLSDGSMKLGHVDGEEVVLARRGDEFFAVGAHCTHYGGPLAEGLVVDGTVRCPWHHACFELRTGKVLGAPALSSLPCYEVRREGNLVRVLGKKAPSVEPAAVGPSSVVIVGAGPSGLSAAEALRRE